MATSDAAEDFAQKTDQQLEREIQSFTTKREELVAQIRELMFAERPREGIVYAKELHEARQEKIRVETEILFRQQHLRRRRLSAGPLQ